MNDTDDLLVQLGVTLPAARVKSVKVECGQHAPSVRHTAWTDRTTWTHGGYLARIRRVTCLACEEVQEVFEGVYSEEVKTGGARRLQALGQGAQWPTGTEHRLEISESTSAMCGKCVRDLGFSRETRPEDGITLVVEGH